MQLYSFSKPSLFTGNWFNSLITAKSMLSIVMYSGIDFQTKEHQLFVEKGKFILIYLTLKYSDTKKTTFLQQWLHSCGERFVTGFLPRQSWFVALQQSYSVDITAAKISNYFMYIVSFLGIKKMTKVPLFMLLIIYIYADRNRQWSVRKTSQIKTKMCLVFLSLCYECGTKARIV